MYRLFKAIQRPNVLQNGGEWQEQDEKLAALSKLLQHTHPNNKALIFTHADTVRYLADNLATRNIVKLSGVTAQSKNPTELAGRFSPV